MRLERAIWLCAAWAMSCGDDPPRIEPADAHVIVDPGVAVQPIQFRVTTGAGSEPDVTWRVDPPGVGTFASDGTFTPAGIGGDATITAGWNGAELTTGLTVTLHAEVFLDGTDAGAGARFDAASPDPQAIAIEYPDDGTILPANLPPVELQWSQVADDDLYRIRLSRPDLLDVTIYAHRREAIAPAELWRLIAATTPDLAIAVHVDGVGPANLRHASLDRSVTIAADLLDPRPIYTHGFLGQPRGLDPIAATEHGLANDVPALQDGQCTGCHRFARDGARAAYLRRVTGAPSLPINAYGVVRYDATDHQYAETIAPATGAWAGLPAFNPVEAATAPAMLMQVEDPTRLATLVLVDPDTGAPVPSNLAAALDGGPTAGQTLSFPDWAPDGTYVAITFHDPQYPDTFVGSAAYGSIARVAVSYAAATGFSFGASTVIASRTTGAADETDLLPAISPDSSAIVFVRGTTVPQGTQYGTANRHVAVVLASGGTVFEVAGSVGPTGTDWGSSMPQWAPTAGSRYAWIVFTSRRSYGHVAPQDGSFSPMHLWVAAVDRAELAAGTVNPTRPAFFLRGQDLAETYVLPQWPAGTAP